MSVPEINEMTLDELRPILAAALPADAAFDGWTRKALLATAERKGVNPDVAMLAFPGGAMDMIAGWFAVIDRRMVEAVPPERLAAMKVRERIAGLVEARLDALASDREALRRAQAVLALPVNTPRAAQLGWRAADAIWRAAGDDAVDFNHYSKRAILGALYAATLLIFVNDESDGFTDTRAFLARRIEGVMRFEKAKAGLRARREGGFSLARLLGRLRYPGAA